MWRVENKVTGKMQCWYEAELIDEIKSILEDIDIGKIEDDSARFNIGLVKHMIQEFER
jgi:hypothetical protein